MAYRLTRREVLAAGATAGAGLALQGFSASTLRALAAPVACGALSDIEHVVIFIQENRGFDHYFGTYRGVRGFGDPAALVQPSSGRSVFYQGDGGRVPPYGPPTDFLTPFHIDSFNGLGECTNDITHDWAPQHFSWNSGGMDQFLTGHLIDDAVNGPMTMGYYTRADLAYYYALADAFTLCDAYHCSVIGPTDPNRLYSISATLDPDGHAGGPWLSTLVTNRETKFGSLTWTTMPEQLQARGISWKVYGDPTGHYGDNVLPYFAKYAGPSADPNLVAGGLTPAFPADFLVDCQAGTLPQVSWVLGPLQNSEHPPAPTAWGEAQTAQVLNALTGNAALWAHTVLFVTWDENGGFFDHVPPPASAPGTTGEWLTAAPTEGTTTFNGNTYLGPIGLGFRVPMLVCSPFSRGGYVCSDTFDHASTLLFIERRFGAEVPNLTAWRRQTVGDLTSALNMAAVDVSVPSISQPSFTDARVIGTNSDCPTDAPADLIDQGLPVVTTYPVPQPNPAALPAQEAGAALRPSGLSCTEPAIAPSGPPLFLAGAAAVALGVGAFLRRRARLMQQR